MDISKDVPPKRSFGASAARKPPPSPPSTSTTHGVTDYAGPYMLEVTLFAHHRHPKDAVAPP
eukprot:2433291-Amphidinium_carterae.1